MLKFLRSLPRPLVLAAVAAGVARAGLAVGDPVGDPFWTSVTAVAVGAAAGLFTTNSVLAVVRSLDAKLVSTVLTIGAARLILALGGDPLDPFVASVISLGAGSIVGYVWPNAGTILRTEQESGNPNPAGR
jgi:hypothetical protein